jgi:hypothetical protein
VKPRDVASAGARPLSLTAIFAPLLRGACVAIYAGDPGRDLRRYADHLARCGFHARAKAMIASSLRGSSLVVRVGPISMSSK